MESINIISCDCKSKEKENMIHANKNFKPSSCASNIFFSFLGSRKLPKGHGLGSFFQQIAIFTLFLLCFSSSAFPNEITPADFPRLASAIYLAEGGASTKFPYGIKSVKCAGEAHCRQVCLNTIRNKYKSWSRLKAGSFLEFLASKYCPLNDPSDIHGLNKNWISNVSFHFKKLGGEL